MSRYAWFSSVLLGCWLSTAAWAQTPPQTVIEVITVSAREAEVITRAVNTLRSSRDPLVAQTVADNILRLSDAMAASGRVHEIGPLTEQELTVVALPEFLTRHAVPGGPIRLQVRATPATVTGPVYTLSRASFIALCADIASTGFLQMRVTQEIKMIVVARMIADLNEQQHELIPEREILVGLLKGFEAQDRRGVIIGRVLGIADAMAESGAEYALVPPAEMAAFRELGHMEKGVFEPVTGRKGVIRVRYNEQVLETSVNHFVWFFIRFLLADQSQGDWNTRARRTHLGSQLLDYLTLQLQVNALDTAVAALDVAGAASADGLHVVSVYARGPGPEAVKRAPGASLRPSARGGDYVDLVIAPKQSRNRADVRAWLMTRAAELREKLAR